MMISMRNEPPDFLGTTASGLCSCAAHYFNIYIHLEGEITCIVFVFIDRLFFGKWEVQSAKLDGETLQYTSGSAEFL